MKLKERTLVPVREQLYEQIKELILINTYQPGSIIQIDRLAEEFGLSITPIREALIRLEAAGFVRMIPNKGVQISEIREEDIRNTWELRRLLEPYAARQAAELALEPEISRLRSTMNAFLAGAFDFEIYARTDIELHELLYTHLPNKLLRETIRRVHLTSMRMRYFAEKICQVHDAVMEEVTHEHLTIVDALAAHDPDHAAASIYLHLMQKPGLSGLCAPNPFRPECRKSSHMALRLLRRRTYRNRESAGPTPGVRPSP